MAVSKSSRPATYTTYTLRDMDPLSLNGNDLPTFLIEKVTSIFLNQCETLREFVYNYFSNQNDMLFVSELSSSTDARATIMNKWYQQFVKIYDNKCPAEVKILLENIVFLDDYQLGIVLNIIGSNLLFCFIRFGFLGIEEFINNLVAQKLILKYGNITQIEKYVCNNKESYEILFAVNEKASVSSDLLNVGTNVKSSVKNKTETVIKGHKWMVPYFTNYKNSKTCILLLVINNDINDVAAKNKISLKDQFSLILIESDFEFESKIQKLLLHSDRFVSYYELKFNSINLFSNISQMLLGPDGKGVTIMEYKARINQLFYNIFITTNTQNTLNYLLQKGNDDLEVMLQPPKLTKIVNTDSFKQNFSKQYAELKILASYCFTTIFDLSNTANENCSLNFSISKLMIPQKCEKILNWITGILEDKIFLQENIKLRYLKEVFYWFQTVEKSTGYLMFNIGKTKISGFFRIQRGLKTRKLIEGKINDQENESSEKTKKFENSLDSVMKNGSIVFKSSKTTSIKEST
ncbi:hypothetical protein QEN19_000204 [Hanseniaspora menglaensis]